jgi:hypothetical protein
LARPNKEVMPAGKLLGNLLGTLLLLAVALGCGGSRAFVLAESARKVRAAIEAAQKSGARHCAPRELALARAHFDFAQRGLEADDYFGAEDHLRMAESNAIEARRLSPRERCAHDPPATPAGALGVPSPAILRSRLPSALRSGQTPVANNEESIR